MLDTHVVLWWVDGDRRLSIKAGREIARADEVLVSPISCWEIATLLRLGRIKLDRDVYRWIQDVLETERVTLADLSPQASVAAGWLPTEGFRGDPADCFLYTQARERAVPLITKDRRIREHSRKARDVNVLW